MKVSLYASMQVYACMALLKYASMQVYGIKLCQYASKYVIMQV